METLARRRRAGSPPFGFRFDSVPPFSIGPRCPGRGPFRGHGQRISRPHRAPPAASAAPSIGDDQGRVRRARASRVRRGRSVAAWIGLRLWPGRREKLRRVLGYPLRLGDRVFGRRSRGREHAPPSRPPDRRARPRRDARDRPSPAAQGAGGARARRASRAPPNRAVAQVLSSKRLGVSRGRRIPRRAGRCRRLRSRPRSRSVDGLSSSG